VHPIGCWGKPTRPAATDAAGLQAALELAGSDTATSGPRRPADAAPGEGGQGNLERAASDPGAAASGFS
jgi:hypothetical protein